MKTMIDTAVAESSSFEEFYTFLTFRERVGLYVRLKRMYVPSPTRTPEELDAEIARSNNLRSIEKGCLMATLLEALEARIEAEVRV